MTLRTLSRRSPALLLAFAAGGIALALGATGFAAPPRRVEVPADLIHVDDGDSIVIAWPEGEEIVRILGIDTPEVLHLDHDIPYAQPFGEQALGFLQGCLAATERIELLRSGERDRYGRTLGYLFLGGRNYSLLVLEARLAAGPAERYGDNGLPEEWAACRAAAERAGPVPFEAPDQYRTRMRRVTAWLKENGLYPKVERAE